MNSTWEDELNKMGWSQLFGKSLPTTVLISDVIPFIHSLLKQQREMCVNEAKMYFANGKKYKNITDAILNAPEPTMEDK